MASSMMGVTNTAGMIVAALLGGIAGALILVFAYFVGIALVGAGLGAFIAHAGWGAFRPGDPPAVAVIVLAIVGALLAMVLQRYVIIVSTSVRRRVDDDPGRCRHVGGQGVTGGCGRFVDFVSAVAGARPALGVGGLGGARPAWDGGADRDHGEEEVVGSR